MSNRRTFTSARATEPNLDELRRQLRVLDATAGVSHQIGTQSYVVKKETVFTAPQINAAQNVIDNAPADTPQLMAQTVIDHMPLEERAWKQMEIEEFNRLRAALTALGAPNLPPLTLSAVLAEWRTTAGQIS